MNTRFFMVPDTSKLGTEYLAYIQNRPKILEAYKQFASENEIEAVRFFPCASVLIVQATDKDQERFRNQLAKNPKDGMRQFKKKSTINMKWVEMIKTKELTVKYTPLITMYFKSHGASHYQYSFEQIFDKIYCVVSCNTACSPPDDIIEIRGSEYYTTLETWESTLKTKQGNT